MIGVTKMVCGTATVSEVLTYGRDSSRVPARLIQFSQDDLPVTVWNVTGACNLECVHCYASATKRPGKGELTFEEGKELIDDLAEMKVPVLLFSGGEPLIRHDIFDLIRYASDSGIRCSISTNGTLITPEVAEKLKKSGAVYVGVSIDGLPDTNDKFRGGKNAFNRAIEGLENAKEAGINTGIRFTVTRYNYGEVPEIIDLLIEKEIPRFCLYHLVPSGRASFKDDITPSERRALVDYLFQKTIELHDDGINTEILTVDNPADGVYIYLKLRELDPDLADSALQLLKYRGGDNSGRKIADIDMYGNVHPNQFWWDYTVGNIRERKFSEMWLSPDDELIIKLRNKSDYLRGEKCGRCRFKEICGGFRLRALRAGDLWGDDPDCYLTDKEIGIA